MPTAVFAPVFSDTGYLGIVWDTLAWQNLHVCRGSLTHHMDPMIYYLAMSPSGRLGS